MFFQNFESFFVRCPMGRTKLNLQKRLALYFVCFSIIYGSRVDARWPSWLTYWTQNHSLKEFFRTWLWHCLTWDRIKQDVYKLQTEGTLSPWACVVVSDATAIIQATDKVRTNGQNHQAEQREREMARTSRCFMSRNDTNQCVSWILCIK